MSRKQTGENFEQLGDAAARLLEKLEQRVKDGSGRQQAPEKFNGADGVNRERKVPSVSNVADERPSASDADSIDSMFTVEALRGRPATCVGKTEKTRANTPQCARKGRRMLMYLVASGAAQVAANGLVAANDNRHHHDPSFAHLRSITARQAEPASTTSTGIAMIERTT